MMSELPFDVKQEALRRLQQGDFKAAKALHDQWVNSQNRPSREPAKNTSA